MGRGISDRQTHEGRQMVGHLRHGGMEQVLTQRRRRGQLQPGLAEGGNGPALAVRDRLRLFTAAPLLTKELEPHLWPGGQITPHDHEIAALAKTVDEPEEEDLAWFQ